MENQALETIRSMSDKQAKEIAQVVRCLKGRDKASAYAVIEGMDVDTRDLLIAYIEAVQAERKEADA